MTLRVTIEHLHTVPSFGRKPGYCNRGARAWWERHGLDWGDFVRNGIEAERLSETGCPLILALVEHARTVEAEREQK